MSSQIRLERSKSQKFFLLNYVHNPRRWILNIAGTSNNYIIQLTRRNISCSCPDFEKRHDYCKHLYFLFNRVLNIEEEEFKLWEIDIKFEQFDLLDQKLIEKIEKYQPPIIAETNPICVICFEQVGKYPCLCEGCGQQFHNYCLTKWEQGLGYWIGALVTCPHCRHHINRKRKRNEYDPMEAFDPNPKVI